jgi:hypothetical protein
LIPSAGIAQPAIGAGQIHDGLAELKPARVDQQIPGRHHPNRAPGGGGRGQAIGQGV